MKTFFELREANIKASELDEKLNVNKIHKAIDAGKSMDAIVGMFANRRTTNTDEIRKVVKDYKFKNRMKTEANIIIEATAGDHEEAAMAHDIAAKSVRQDLRAKKAHQQAAEHHYDAADHIENGNHEKANASHVKAKNAAAAAKQYGNKHSANAYADTHAVKRVPTPAYKYDFGEMKTEANIVKSADKKPENYIKPDGTMGTRMVPTTKRSKEEGFVSAAQRKAVWASKADGGKGHPDNKKSKKEDATSDAIAAFKAKGGKIKKLAPGKAAGYHGKDDPGADVHGMISRGDTKDMGTRKKVKSMESVQVDEISKDTKKSYIKKAVNDIDNRSFTRAYYGLSKGLGDKSSPLAKGDSKNNTKIANRRKGINRALEANETEPPFDNAVLRSKKPAKDQYGNIIKNRAASLARKAAKAQADKVKK